MANKIIITWDDSKVNITLESGEPVSTREMIGVLEYAKLHIFEREEKD